MFYKKDIHATITNEKYARLETKSPIPKIRKQKGKTTENLTRLDFSEELRKKILPHCRLQYGEIWTDPEGKHKVGVFDASNSSDVKKLFGEEKTRLIINDPPYNVVAGNANTKNLFKIEIQDYISFSKKWVQNALAVMDKNSSLYAWLGADQNDGFQPPAGVYDYDERI